MKKLNLDTKNFESRVTEGVVVARFKEHAMDILTDVEAGSGFLDFLERAVRFKAKGSALLAPVL